MTELETCPRCRAARLAVVYFDANGELLGGHLQCPDCGPRHSEAIAVDSEPLGDALLERKAS